MIENCVFCGKKRKGEEPSLTDWVSDIHIVSNKENVIFEKMSVCPNCRNRKISELYGATLEKKVIRWKMKKSKS